jgi:hypothetical protein
MLVLFLLDMVLIGLFILAAMGVVAVIRLAEGVAFLVKKGFPLVCIGAAIWLPISPFLPLGPGLALSGVILAVAGFVTIACRQHRNRSIQP